jgi:protein tyrosine phosphatase
MRSIDSADVLARIYASICAIEQDRLQGEEYAMTHAVTSRRKHLNRYTDILPFDANRVRLEVRNIN